ncbi:MAG: Gldg family protein, partial [Cyclobacteriaceae bacterium]|nr:Gldg family protein [Cyclobacteriaceae bacterium]
MKRSKVISQVLIFVGILIVINLISDKLFFRLDFTADQRYTLSDATKDILNDLDDVITVTAYFTKDLPPQLEKSRKDFEDLLIEYENRSGGNVVYEFINPNESEEEEQKAQQKGISPVMVNVTEKDQVKQLRAYLGAVLQMGDKTEIIPMIQPGAGMEYSLTTSIKKISVLDKPKVAFLQGHGEPSPNASVQVLQQLTVLYDVAPYTITDTADIPTYFKTIAIVNPTDTFSQADFVQLDRYLSSGGGIYLAYSNLQTDLQSQYLSALPDIGIMGWLADKGITMNNQYVIDATCGAVTVRQQNGPFIMNRQIEFPYFPILSRFSEHPAAKGLESVIMPFVSSISYLPKDSTVNIQPLVFSSENSGVVNTPVFIDIEKQWTESDFNAPSQVVAIAAEGPLSGIANSKLVVIANGAFVNGEGQQQQQVNQDNVNLASNAIDWLSDDTGLIELRTKGITSRPLEQIDDTK